MRSLLGCCAALVLCVSLTSQVIAQTDQTTTRGSEPATQASVAHLGLKSQAPGEAGAYRGLMGRELLRQAVLLTAREQMGWFTRDATLGEPMPRGERAVVLEAKTVVGPDAAQLVLRGVPGDAPWQLSSALKPQAPKHVLVRLLPVAERWSRRQLPDALRKLDLGAGSRPRAFDGNAQESGGLPETIAKPLRRMSVLSQYTAVRRAHERMRASGSSPALLGALVRGYANLGQLTRFHWNGSGPALSSRALLYAQRMVALHGETRFSLAHRAYAYALAGLQRWALADLEAAKEDGGAAQRWAGVVGSYCRHEADALKQVSGDWKPLALYLRFALAEHDRLDRRIIEWGRAALGAQRDCFRVVDRLSDVAGVSLGHRITTYGPRALPWAAWTHLANNGEVPEPVKDALPVPTGRRQSFRTWQLRPVSQTLTKVSRDKAHVAEPSWALLGRFITEINFVQAKRRLAFMSDQWAVSVDDTVKRILPSVRGHRYRDVIEAYRFASHGEYDRFAELTCAPTFTDYHPGWGWFAREWWEDHNDAADKVADALWETCEAQADMTTDNLCYLTHYHGYEGEPTRRYSRRLRQISPRTPLLVVGLINGDWKKAQIHQAQLEYNFGDSPVYLRAMADAFIDHGDQAKAVPLLEKLLNIYPEERWNEKLAYIYLDQGKLEKFIKTRQRQLQHEDYGLSHSDALHDIAEALLDDGQYARAARYADRAAGSGSGWAMNVASRAHEALGNWAQSEQWIEREVKRYGEGDPADADGWATWCLRTGRGNRAAAFEYLKKQLPAPDADVPWDDRSKWAFIYAVQGKRAAAGRFYQNLYEHTDNMYYGIHAMLLAHEQGEKERRDRLMADLLNDWKDDDQDEDERGPYDKLVVMFDQSLDSGEPVPKDAFEKLIADESVGRVTNFLFYIARLHELEGHGERAQRYYQRCLSQSATYKHNYLMAWRRYRNNGGNPYTARFPGSPAAQPGPQEPAPPARRQPAAPQRNGDTGPPPAPR